MMHKYFVYLGLDNICSQEKLFRLQLWGMDHRRIPRVQLTQMHLQGDKLIVGA